MLHLRLGAYHECAIPALRHPLRFLGQRQRVVGEFAKSAITGTFRGKRPSTAILAVMAHKEGICLIKNIQIYKSVMNMLVEQSIQVDTHTFSPLSGKIL
ncbi:MAG TPA: hypothetical protein DE044_10835 [Alteromonas macleodii]|nr:hypothetical protein [Alteromonas macleodii]